MLVTYTQKVKGKSIHFGVLVLTSTLDEVKTKSVCKGGNR